MARAEIDAAEARIRQAELAPQLELGLELENFAGSGEFNGSDALETTLEVGRALELGDKRQRRAEVARAHRDSAAAGLDVMRLDLATEVARRFVDVLGAQAQLEAAARFLDLALSIRAQAQRRVEAGNALSAELHRAQAEVGREQLFVARSRAELDVARRALAASWGATEPDFDAAAGELFATRPMEPLPDLLAKLEQSPLLARLATRQRVQQAERRLAEAEARPDLAFSLGLRHLHEPGDTALVAGVSLPLGSRARSRALVAESTAAERQVLAEGNAERLDAVQAIGGLHRQVQLRRETLEVLEQEVLPATAAALEQIERGYRLGRLAYGEYALAAREALDAELERVRVATEYHQLRAELDGLTGGMEP